MHNIRQWFNLVKIIQYCRSLFCHLFSPILQFDRDIWVLDGSKSIHQMWYSGALSIDNSALISSIGLCKLSSYLNDRILSHWLLDLTTQGRYSLNKNFVSFWDSFNGPNKPLKRHTGKPVAFNSNHLSATSPNTVGGRSASTCQKSCTWRYLHITYAVSGHEM